ncbi:hypothetical protein [Sphingobium sp. YR657]|uniref:hypothetical protein n=1 Tax=Sphingobium sp. YR657 TaxID=1884366 RepID=UPI001114F4AB|nr:hypothetical protein [Sphingobium sp. YR657]
MGVEAELLNAQAEASHEDHGTLLPQVVASTAETELPLDNVPPHDDFLTPIEEQVIEHLNARYNSPELRIRWLARAAAANSRIMRFEKSFRLMLRSQILFLKQIKARGPQRFEDAEPLFGGLPVHFSSVDQNSWTGFLINEGLVAPTDGRYELTPHGREFLRWMDDVGAIVEMKVV